MATKDIYEKGKLDIKVKLKDKSKKETDTARLILIVDGEDQAPITLNVKKQTVTHNHVFADVAATKDNYLLTYRVEHDTETIRSSTEYRVWPLTATVKLVNEVDFAPLKDIAFDLKFESGEVSHFRTGDDGTCLCKLKYKSLFSIPSLPHVSFMEWQRGKDHGRDRVAVMAVVTYKAQIVTPAGWVGTTVKQYVNVASEHADAQLGDDKQGTKVAITVKLVDALDAARPISAPIGHDIHIKVTLSEMTRRNADLPTLIGVQGLDASKKNIIKGKVQSGLGGVVPPFTLQLGLGGKEKIKLQIGTTVECADVEVNFESCRKIWLQAIVTAGRKPDIAAATDAMKKVAIELLAEADVDVAGAAPPPGSIVDGAAMGAGGPQLIVGDHNVNAFTALWTKTHDPLSAYAVFCDYQFDAGEAPMSKTVSFAIPKDKQIDWPPGGGQVPGFATAPVPDGALLSVNLHNGNPAASGTWAVEAPVDHEHHGKTGAFPADHLYINWATHKGLLLMKLPDEVVPIVASGVRVKARAVVHYAKGPYNGWAPSDPRGGVVVALSNSSGARPAGSINQTLVHEIGHLLNQVDDVLGAGVALTREADHKWHYTGRDHSGGHCAFGVSRSVYKSGGSMKGQAAATCVMYGAGSTTRGIDYCVKCAPFVLAEPMESLT